MQENLQNLNNCPKDGVAVKEVSKQKRLEVASEIGNRSILEEKQYSKVKGENIINQTEATKALFKIADELVKWGLATCHINPNLRKIKAKETKLLWEDVCINQTEATKALFKIADELVKWGLATCHINPNLRKIKAKETKLLWEDVCIVKGYKTITTEKNKVITTLDRFIDIEQLVRFHNDFISVGRDWDNVKIKGYLDDLNISKEDMKDLLDSYERLSTARGLATQSEWLELALDYLQFNPDCLAPVEDKIDIVLRYKFSMDSYIKREFVKVLSRMYRTSNKCKNISIVDRLFSINKDSIVLRYKFSMDSYIKREFVKVLSRMYRTSNKCKNISIVDRLFSINKDSNKLLHLLPTIRHIHEVYEMPIDSDIDVIEYMSVQTLEDYLDKGVTLQKYKEVLYFRDKLPESLVVDLIHKINKNRLDNDLSVLAITETKSDNDNSVIRF